ncbi:MAG TPA: hypothetical protein VN653_06305 [Anaerolineales bacterium]|jgi:hypothetical protein|nr:hypothetical protein [Anaerolineales bacterium]
MALKNKFIRTTFSASLSLLLLVFAALVLSPISVLAQGNNPTLPTLAEFSKKVQNGQADVLRGVYVANVLALPIIQQPSADAGYVSTNEGEATQFQMASQYGNVGLLAHNHLAGKSFSALAVGQEINLIYGDGHIEHFVVKEILKYQALKPTSPYSSFRNLDKDEVLSARQMFKRVYLGDRHVTFQTCLSVDGNQSWGRLFVIATPK